MPSDAKKRGKEKKKEKEKESNRPKKKPQTKPDAKKTENVGTVATVNTAGETKDLGVTGDVVPQVHETTSGAEDLQQKKPQTKSDEQKPDDLGTVVTVNTSGEAKDIGNTGDVVSQVNETASGVEDDPQNSIPETDELRQQKKQVTTSSTMTKPITTTSSTMATTSSTTKIPTMTSTEAGTTGTTTQLPTTASTKSATTNTMTELQTPASTTTPASARTTKIRTTPTVTSSSTTGHQFEQTEDKSSKISKASSKLKSYHQDPEHKNWQKAGLCYYTAKEVLAPCVEEVCKDLHKDLTSLCKFCTCTRSQRKIPMRSQRKIPMRSQRMLCRDCEKKWKDKFKDFTARGYNINDIVWRKNIVEQPAEHLSVLKCFVQYDQEDKHSVSDCDISPILAFIVRKNRNEYVHGSEARISNKKLQDYKRNLLNLLKNGRLKATRKADEAQHFIEEVCDSQYIIKLEDEVKAEFSACEGKWDCILSRLDDHDPRLKSVEQRITDMRNELKKLADQKANQSDLDLQKRILEDQRQKICEIVGDIKSIQGTLHLHGDMLQSHEHMLQSHEKKLTDIQDQKKKIFQKDKVQVGIKPTEEELKNIQLLLTETYRSLETISISPALENAKNIKDLEDFYTDVVIEEVDEESVKENKDKPQDKKVVTSFRQIFRADGKIKRVVLQAVAGCGKTTFCRKLVKSWSHVHRKRQNTVSGDGSANNTQDSGLKDEDEMQRFDLLLYVNVKNVSSENLLDAFFNQFPLVQQQNENHPYKPYFTHLITEAKDNKVLLILDGLDDMDTSATFIEEIMKRKLFPTMTVLATTRPWKIEQLQLSQSAHMDLFLDLKGFSYVNRIRFAEKILGKYYGLKDRSGINDFKKHVSANRMISSLIHIPLLLLFLVHVWYNKKSFPQTILELYIGILNIVVERYKYKKIKGQQNVEGPDEKTQAQQKSSIKRQQNGEGSDEKTQAQQKSWPLENKVISGMSLVQHFDENFLNAFCDVACQFLSEDRKKNSCVFKEEELVKLLGTDGESKLRIALELGLLSKSESPGVWNKTTNVSFFHKTIQEFLVAISICCIEERFKTFLYKLNTVQDVLENENIIIFTAGISASHCGKISEKICKILDTNSQLRIYDNSICRLYKDCVREAHDKDTWLKMQYLSADSLEEWNVLYSALQSTEDVKYLKLSEIDITLRECKTRFDISQYTQLAEICLMTVQINDATLEISSSTLTKFHLSEATLAGKSKVILSKCNQLQIVCLIRVEVTNESQLVLSECRHLEVLCVEHINNDDATCTVDISESVSLIHLQLCEFSMTSKCKLLMTVLPQLQSLTLEYVRLENLNLESNCLTHLQLLDVTTTSEGKLVLPKLTQAESIFAYNVVINNTTLDLSGSMYLTKIWLYNVRMNSGSKLILSGCPQLTQLRLENLNLNNISLDLTESSSLTKLVLSNITVGVKMELPKCTQLRHLELKNIDLNDLANVTKSEDCIQNLLQYVSLQEVILQNVSVGNATLDLPKCLKALTLDHVIMSSDKMTLLFESLSQCKHLESLKLFNLDLGNTLDFSKFNSLKALTLFYLTMSSDKMALLFESLSQCKHLESLALYNLNLSNTLLKNDILERLKSLECFNLVDLGNTLDFSKCNSLEVLRLQNVTMSSNVKIALFEGMSHCKQLESLILIYLDLINTSLEMDMFKRLEILLMSDLTVSSECASECAARIQSDPKFSHLEIVKIQDSDRYVLNDVRVVKPVKYDEDGNATDFVPGADRNDDLEFCDEIVDFLDFKEI